MVNSKTAMATFFLVLLFVTLPNILRVTRFPSPITTPRPLLSSTHLVTHPDPDPDIGSGVQCMRPDSRPYQGGTDRVGGVSLETCLFTRACAVDEKIFLFHSPKAGAPSDRLPLMLDTRSLGGHNSGTVGPQSRKLLEVVSADPEDNLTAFAARHNLTYLPRTSVAVSSEFNPLNFGHVIIDDVGMAFLAADAFNLGPDFFYGRHLKEDQSNVAKRIAGALKEDIFTSERMVNTKKGFCVENIVVGTAYYNARNPTHCADGASWARLGNWLSSRILTNGGVEVSQQPASLNSEITHSSKLPHLVIGDKGEGARRGIQNVEDLATEGGELSKLFRVTVARFHNMSHVEAALLMADCDIYFTPTGGISFTGLFLPAGALMVTVRKTDHVEDSFWMCLSHIHVVEYIPIDDEVRPGAKGSGQEGRHAPFSLDTERVVQFLKRSWEQHKLSRTYTHKEW